MTDIIERLRRERETDHLAVEAADEIERLRSEVSRWQAACEEARKLARAAEVYRVTQARRALEPEP